MKLMNLSHITILPYLACNFKCPYCVAEPIVKMSSNGKKNSLIQWTNQFENVVTFLNSIDTKAIMVSGGEPFIWNGWKELIARTNHYWSFLTNASGIPIWLQDEVAINRVKLFIAAFHNTEIPVHKFIANVQKIQNFGYPVFAKVIYVGDNNQFEEIDTIAKANIPVSFVPLLNMKYSNEAIEKVLMYCQSSMYANRFLPPHNGANRITDYCPAGTSESFELNGSIIARCSHFSNMSLNNIPQLIRKLNPMHFGDILHPKFHNQPNICYRKTCACEWHNFSDMSFGFENEKWQHFIETREWEPATISDIREFESKASSKGIITK